MYPKVEVAEHPVSIPVVAANQAVPTAAVKAPTAPMEYHLLVLQHLMQTAAQNHTAVAHTK